MFCMLKLEGSNPSDLPIGITIPVEATVTMLFLHPHEPKTIRKLTNKQGLPCWSND